MNRKFSILAIAIFLAVQALSFLHVAEYGVQEHEHNGQICEILLNVENAKIVTADASAKITIPYNLSVTKIIIPELLFSSNLSQAFNSRAPPFIS